MEERRDTTEAASSALLLSVIFEGNSLELERFFFGAPFLFGVLFSLIFFSC